MNKKELEAFAKEAAKTLKTEKDLSDFSRMLKKITVEAALNGEMDDHSGYEKHQISDNSNSRNGHSSKTLYTDDSSGPQNLDNARTLSQLCSHPFCMLVIHRIRCLFA